MGQTLEQIVFIGIATNVKYALSGKLAQLGWESWRNSAGERLLMSVGLAQDAWERTVGIARAVSLDAQAMGFSYGVLRVHVADEIRVRVCDGVSCRSTDVTHDGRQSVPRLPP